MSFCLWLCQQQTRVRSFESIKLWHGERKLVSILFHMHTDTLIDSLNLCDSLDAYVCFSLFVALIHPLIRLVAFFPAWCVHRFHMKVPFSFSFSLWFMLAFLLFSCILKPVFRVSFCSRNENNEQGNMKMLIAFTNCQWHQWSTSNHRLFHLFLLNTMPNRFE